MEIFASTQQTKSGAASNRYFDTLVCLVAYPIAIFVLIKIILTASAFAMETFASIGTAVPPVTGLAARGANALAYQAFYWVFDLGLVLGGIHAALWPYPARRRQFALAAGGLLMLATGLMLTALALPLFQQ